MQVGESEGGVCCCLKEGGGTGFTERMAAERGPPSPRKDLRMFAECWQQALVLTIFRGSEGSC